MKPSSAKAKGRLACQEARAALLAAFPELAPDDVLVTSSGAPGEDLLLSPRARALMPFSIEVKNQERLQIHAALKQAEAHASKRPGSLPILIFRRNRTELHVALKLSDFLKLITSRKGGKTNGNDEESAREKGSGFQEAADCREETRSVI